MDKPIKVKKYSGEEVNFEVNKLIQSLKSAQADDDVIHEIVEEVSNKLYDGIPTKHIYNMAFKRLKSKNNIGASRYKLKRAIMELGPTGYPFEQFAGAILRKMGYSVKVGVVVQGHCVHHEVDVIATNDHHHYMVECKFHNSQSKINSVQTPLYIQARFEDIERKNQEDQNLKNKFHQGWILTNTRFSSDAIQYSECIGLKLISWDYPKTYNLKEIIRNNHLYPITSLTTITKKEKQQLLENDVVLCVDLLERPSLLDQLNISKAKKRKVLQDLESLCPINN